MTYRFIPYITNTGPCPTGIIPISCNGPCPTVTPPISQVLVHVLSVYPLCHKYWTLPLRYFPYITSTGPCPTVTYLNHRYMYWTLSHSYLPYITRTGPYPTATSPISQVLVPVLQLSPIYHKYWSLSYR